LLIRSNQHFFLPYLPPNRHHISFIFDCSTTNKETMAYDAYQGRDTQYPKTTTEFALHEPPPFGGTNYNPAYGAPGQQPRPISRFSGFDPRGWRTRTQVIAAGVVVVVIIAIIVGAYEGWKSNRYPNYSTINYSLKDTFEGENFFDNFWYWSAADPTSGFVV
jgi:hypothetical protein